MTITAVLSDIGITEGEGNISFCAEINNIPPFGGLETDVSVMIDGSGIDTITEIGEDFSFDSTELVFPNSTTINGDRKCVNVHIIDDQELEGDNQKFEIFLVSDSLTPMENVAIGGNNITVVTIADDTSDGKEYNYSTT